MSKIIYYMGAGASFGRKDAREYVEDKEVGKMLFVHEGLPVINEIGPALLAFKDSISKTKIDTDGEYVFFDRYRTSGSSIIATKNELVQGIDRLYKATIEHATIDTYARKLFLTRRMREFKELKNILCAFFVWIQIHNKADQRYDTFLANVLNMRLFLPKEISVISWNYDSQFEIAYRYYTPNDKLSIYEKNNESGVELKRDDGKIYKVNGSATFGDFNAVNEILKVKDGAVDPQILLIMFYGNLLADTSELGFQCRSHLSFAWEDTDRQKEMMTAIQQATSDTESLVVIGYSFPYFNRETDRAIFASMPNLKTIYIQDPNPEAVEPSLRAVLPEGSKVRIEHQKDCTQFYLPREL